MLITCNLTQLQKFRLKNTETNCHDIFKLKQLLIQLDLLGKKNQKQNKLNPVLFPRKPQKIFQITLIKYIQSLGSLLIHNHITVPFFITETAMKEQSTILPLDGAKCFTRSKLKTL